MLLSITGVCVLLINDDMIFLHTPPLKKREGEKGKRVRLPSPAVCNLSTSATYSTDTGIKTVVKRWYDVDMTAYRPLF